MVLSEGGAEGIIGREGGSPRAGGTPEMRIYAGNGKFCILKHVASQGHPIKGEGGQAKLNELNIKHTPVAV